MHATDSTTPPVARRRVHNKTRTGCTGCKQQRKKCDERKPTCSNCKRREITCSLSYLSIRTVFPPSAGSLPSLSAELNPLALDLQSLELLHHYTSVACLTLSTPRRATIWQVLMPQMALNNNFLMHGILAVSALHLASLQPLRQTELVIRAAASEHLALMAYRRFFTVEDSKTVHAALAFGAFVIPYVLAIQGSEQTVARLPTPNDSNPHWFFLVRGLIHLVIRTWPALKSGPFGPMLTQNHDPIDFNANPDDHHLCRLYSLFDDTASSEPGERQIKSICKESLNQLRNVFTIPYRAHETLDVRSMIYIWPGSISEEFMELVYERRPEALVILAHYCVILKKNNGCWYLKDTGKNMIRAIEEALDPEWGEWIEWAVNFPSG